jgi:preprotein translocase subunit SecD
VPGSTWFSKQSFHLGLDLKGGTELIYEADTSNIPGKDVEYAVSGARDVIERRVNVFGVAEPLIQTAKSDNGYRLIVDLPGIKNPDQAIKMIGETPTLEFRSLAAGDSSSTPNWEYTGLTGKYLQSAIVNFDSQTVEPEVAIEFNAEGAKIFGDLTTQNVGKPIAIFLDNQLISAPTVNMAITSGKAVISGRFTLVEAKELASRLSAGALPLPIKLISLWFYPMVGSASLLLLPF